MTDSFVGDAKGIKEIGSILTFKGLGRGYRKYANGNKD
jgi:hypothetical protein